MALEEAAASQLPMLEVLAALDCKRAARGSGEVADAVIDAACVKMGKRGGRTARRRGQVHSEAWMEATSMHCARY